MGTRRWRVEVGGVVQGVGFRPAVASLARRAGLVGRVWNAASGAVIELSGAEEALEALLDQIRALPPPARPEIRAVQVLDPAEAPAGFHIAESEGGPGPLAVPPDLAACPACLQEVLDDNQRRYRYAFTSCTQCGPRYTIVEALPFDRAHTAMAGFALCADCAREYADPTDRRCHAQTLACPRCGPQLRMEAGSGIVTGDSALQAAVSHLTSGKIVAVKGIGGFQLLVDATDAAAVARLRARKGRPDRPLAVLLEDLAAARRVLALDAAEEEALASPAAPIVVARVASWAGIAPNVAPGLPFLGAMLPASPLHLLLARGAGRPLVCTSGNRSGAPLAIDLAEARRALDGVADAFLDHDRPVLRPADDSVLRLDAGVPLLLRRARGMPLTLPVAPGPTVLALGAHSRATVALAWGDQLLVSPHLGDLDHPDARDRLRQTVADWLRWTGARPEALACDLHPDYGSTRVAEELAAAMGRPLRRVQHHHAHAAAVLVEHGRAGPALAFCWDGAGYGPDGTIWGGEAGIATARSFERQGWVRPFRLPGGERASREPPRALLGLYHTLQAGDLDPNLMAALRHRLRDLPLEPLLAVLDRGVSAPWTTSAGRLFDAVAFLLGGPSRCSWEAHAALGLEALASGPPAALPLRWDGPALDWAPLLIALLRSDAPREALAMGFHHALASGIAAFAARHELPVVLAGGCFQNALLVREARARLAALGREVLLPAALPPGDGAISAGQCCVTRALLEP